MKTTFRDSPNPVRRLGFLAAMLAVLAAEATAETIRVPEDARSVTEAIARAHPGDRVEIGPGVWSPTWTGERFPLVLAGRDLEIAGAGAGRTILDAEGRSRHFEFGAGDGSRISGLTLREGRAADGGGAILVDAASPGFYRVHVTGSDGEGLGDAVRALGGEPRFRYCLFEGNGPLGPTVRLEAGRTRCERSTMAGNAGPAISLGAAAHLRLAHSIVDRPGAGETASVGLELADEAPGRIPDLERNLFGHCRDGVLRGAPAVVAEVTAAVAETGGLRTGDPEFVAPHERNYRLRADSPARDFGPAGDSGELGAYGGERPLDRDEPSDDDAPAAKGAEGAEADGEAPGILGPNVPNPSHPTTTIHFAVPDASVVDLAIYNVLGQRVRTLHAGDLSAGDHARVWDGRDDHGADLPPGIYFVRVTQGLTSESRRIVLVR